MELTFNKSGKFYIAEATVNSDYNLHIERVSIGGFQMKQKYSGLNYGNCILPEELKLGWKVLDFTFQHSSYPIQIQFISETEVTDAELNELQ